MEKNDYCFVLHKMSLQKILLLDFTKKYKTISHYIDKEIKISKMCERDFYESKAHQWDRFIVITTSRCLGKDINGYRFVLCKMPYQKTPLSKFR